MSFVQLLTKYKPVVENVPDWQIKLMIPKLLADFGIDAFTVTFE